MEFGKINDVSRVDWAIPIDDPKSLQFLKSISTTSPLKIHFGTPAWGHREWIGKIYPPRTKPADFLHHYSKYYSCIELNTTHYRIPSMKQAELWKRQVSPDFMFCPKVFQGISHSAQGLRDINLLKTWIEFLKALGPNCGPCFLQLPPYFDYSLKQELFLFLRQWPDEFALSLEFRHPSWFQHGRILGALTEYLQSRRIGLIITDVAGRRDVLHTSISAPFALLRFVGNNLDPSDFDRAIRWTERFQIWEKAGLKNLFLFIHEPDDILAPEMTDLFLKQLKAHWPNLPNAPKFESPSQLSFLNS